MCAEKLFWKCHRRILSDYLVSQNVEVIHILGSDESSIHKLSSSAVATEMGVTYPVSESKDAQMSLFDLNAQTDSKDV